VWGKNSSLYVKAIGNSLIILENCSGTIEASDNANITTTNSHHKLSASGEANIRCLNYNLYGDTALLIATGKAQVWIINSTAIQPGGIHDYMYFADETEFWIINSTVKIANLIFSDNSVVWAVNSYIDDGFNRGTKMSVYNNSRLIYGWFLEVNVKSPEDKTLENITVEIYFSNNTLAAKAVTDSNGHAQFILAKQIKQNSGDQYFDSYTIKAYNVNFAGEAQVDLDSNKEITLKTQHYPSYTVFAAIVAIIASISLTGLIVHNRKRKQKM
jgi:hypothetical protein